MKKWEYTSTESWYAQEEIHLKTMGEQGWELCCVIYGGKNYFYYWKRPLPDGGEKKKEEL